MKIEIERETALKGLSEPCQSIDTPQLKKYYKMYAGVAVPKLQGFLFDTMLRVYRKTFRPADDPTQASFNGLRYNQIWNKRQLIALIRSYWKRFYSLRTSNSFFDIERVCAELNRKDNSATEARSGWLAMLRTIRS